MMQQWTVRGGRQRTTKGDGERDGTAGRGTGRDSDGRRARDAALWQHAGIPTPGAHTAALSLSLMTPRYDPRAPVCFPVPPFLSFPSSLPPSLCLS